MRLSLFSSLRARLLWFLLLAISFAALVQAAVSYRTALEDADRLFDYHMQQTALSLRSGVPLSNYDAPELNDNNGDSDLLVQVWTADGVRVYQSTTRASLPQRAVLGFSDVKVNGSTYRVFSVQTPFQVVQIAQDLSIRHQLAGALALRSIIPITVMAPLLMLLVWWVVSRSLAPVARVRSQVASRQADDLSPVSTTGLPDEVQPLVQEMNLLFKRVRTAFDAQKNFVGDAAHELRSPLAALKLQVLGLQRATDDTTRELAVSRLAAGIERATRLVEQLLLLARQEANVMSGGSSKASLVDLAETVRLTVADMVATAQTRQIDLGITHADTVFVTGQQESLRILLRNLLDNSIKYTPPGGKVDIQLSLHNDTASIIVDDTGPGIPDTDRERVFDRFYRISGQEAGGSGLGLAIVKTIVDAHQGKIRLEKSPTLGGLRVMLEIKADVQDPPQRPALPA